MQSFENFMDNTNQDQEDETSLKNHFLSRILSFLQVYWYPKASDNRVFTEIIKAWGMLVLLFFLLVGLVALNALNSYIFSFG